MQLSYENISFENLMHGPTYFCFDVDFTAEDKAILENLMLEQGDVHVTMGLGSLVIELVKDDCVIMYQPPTTTLQSSAITLTRPARVGNMTSSPMQINNTPLSLAFMAQSLRAILKSQQLVVLVNTYNIHFEQYLE